MRIEQMKEAVRLLDVIKSYLGVFPERLDSGSRLRSAVDARIIFTNIAENKIGLTPDEVRRLLDVKWASMSYYRKKFADYASNDDRFGFKLKLVMEAMFPGDVIKNVKTL